MNAGMKGVYLGNVPHFRVGPDERRHLVAERVGQHLLDNPLEAGGIFGIAVEDHVPVLQEGLDSGEILCLEDRAQVTPLTPSGRDR